RPAVALGRARALARPGRVVPREEAVDEDVVDDGVARPGGRLRLVDRVGVERASVGSSVAGADAIADDRARRPAGNRAVEAADVPPDERVPLDAGRRQRPAALALDLEPRLSLGRLRAELKLDDDVLPRPRVAG